MRTLVIEDRTASPPKIVEVFQAANLDEVEATSLTESGGSGQARDGRRYVHVAVSWVNTGYKTVQKPEKDVMGGVVE